MPFSLLRLSTKFTRIRCKQILNTIFAYTIFSSNEILSNANFLKAGNTACEWKHTIQDYLLNIENKVIIQSYLVNFITHL